MKSVVWFDDGKRPNVADLLEKEADISVQRLAYDAPQTDNWRALSAAHVYCITSTRQELPAQYRCDASLLARCPDLLAVSTSGAGYDTVNGYLSSHPSSMADSPPPRQEGIPKLCSRSAACARIETLAYRRSAELHPERVRIAALKAAPERALESAVCGAATLPVAPRQSGSARRPGRARRALPLAVLVRPRG